MGLFRVIVFGTLCASSTWISVFFYWFEKLSVVISSNTFLTYLSLPPSETSIMQMLVHLDFAPEAPSTVLFLICFSFLLFSLGHFHYYIFQISIHSSVSCSLFLIPSSMSLISIVVFFSSDSFLYFIVPIKMLDLFIYSFL